LKTKYLLKRLKLKNKEKLKMPRKKKTEENEEKNEIEREIEEKKDEKESIEKEETKKISSTKEAEAIVHIYTSFNNTLVHVTDMSGRTISKVSGGMVTKHDRLKANPTIAMFIAKRITEEIKDLGVKSLYIRIRAKTRNPAPGPGAHAIVKSLSREGFKILNILDTTRFPRGGPKKKGGRRGRRP
jgi:small subunit ribosomal protein S11